MSRLRQVEFAPGIVVGRLQHDGYVHHPHLIGLRRRFQLVVRAA